MKLAIVGSRSFKSHEHKEFSSYGCYDLHRANYAIVEKTLKDLPRPELIVSGGAMGADRLAATYAICNNIPLEEIKPDWTKGKGAGIIRNTEIVAKADMVLAFWDLKSNGTRDSVNKALKAGKPVLIVPVGDLCD